MRPAAPPREEHPVNEHARLRQQLTAIDRFANLSDAEIAAILDNATPVNVPANWSLIWEKTPADKAYIILEGDVAVRRRGEEIARLGRSEEHTSELQSLMRISYAVFCLKKKR